MCASPRHPVSVGVCACLPSFARKSNVGEASGEVTSSTYPQTAKVQDTLPPTLYHHGRVVSLPSYAWGISMNAEWRELYVGLYW